MARAETETLLSLDRFAKIMGISPAHFNQGFGNAVTVFPIKSNRCEDLWPQWSWQYADGVGREDLAREIAKAEDDIAEIVGFYPAPKWIAQEVHGFPRHHRPDVIRSGGLNVRGFHVSIDLNYGKFIEAGQRATTLIGTATTAGGTLTYSLTASTMTATIVLPTTETNQCQIRAYFPGESGDITWKIRDPRSVTISGGNVTLVYDAWLFIKPELWYAFPTAADFGAIDVTASANLLTSVDVYREYNDPTATSAVFYWEPRPQLSGATFTCQSCGGTGCVTCALTTQNGCIFPRDVETGTVVPVVATYDSDSSGWLESAWSECRDPDQVKVYYYAGQLSNRWRNSFTCEPLDDSWARVIARMAASRLERPYCHCGHVTALAVDIRRDLALSGETSYNVPFEVLSNPFGTRKGEVEAWMFVNKIAKRRLVGGTF